MSEKPTPTQEEVLLNKQITKLIGGYCVKHTQNNEKAFNGLKVYSITDEHYNSLPQEKQKKLDDIFDTISTDDQEKITFWDNVFGDFNKSKDLHLVTATFKIEKVYKAKTAKGRYVMGLLGNWIAGYISPIDGKTNSFLLPKTKSLLTLENLKDLLHLGVWDNKNQKQITPYTKFETKEVEKIVEKTRVVTQEKKVGVDKKALEKAKAKVLHSWSKKWQPETVEAILNDFIKEL